MAAGEEVALPSRSTLRIGPLYAFFLLPKTAPAAAPLPLVPKVKQKLSVPGGYAAVIDGCVARHFAAFGSYFTLLDLAKLALEDFPGQGLQEDVTALRNQLGRVLARSVDYDSVPLSSVPRNVLDAFDKVHSVMSASHKGQLKWFCRLDPAGVERKRQRLAKEAATALEAKGEPGKGDVLEVN